MTEQNVIKNIGLLCQTTKDKNNEEISIIRHLVPVGIIGCIMYATKSVSECHIV